MQETERFTLHGFIGDFLGRGARTLASIVTVTALMGIFAFEINVGCELILRSVGLHSISNVILCSLLLALFCAAYCDIGGFAGTARTDKWQNWFGVAATLLLVSFAVLFPQSPINHSNISPVLILDSLMSFSAIPLLVAAGVVCYASVANIVDMSNWQAISANSHASSNEITLLRWTMFKSSIYMILAPAVLGAFIGYMFRGTDVPGDLVFPELISFISDVAGPFSGVALGIVVLGLASAALSTADSGLLASSQAFSWDVRDRVEIDEFIKGNASDASQYGLLQKVRLRLYAFALGAMIIFILARWAIGDEIVFVLQFAIGAMMIPLAPTIFVGLYFRSRGRQLSLAARILMQLSIIAGMAAAIIVFLWSTFVASGFNAYAWSSICTAAVSFGVAFIALIVEGILRTLSR